MSDQMLENNVAELLKRCHRTVAAAQVERSLAEFERRMAVARSPNRWFPAIAAALFVGLAIWIAVKAKPETPKVIQPAVKAPSPDPIPAPQESDEDARLAKADKLRLEGKHAEALKLIDEALVLNPSSEAALELRARTRLDTRDFQEALDAANRGLEIKPKDPELLLMRAEAKYALDDRDGALRDASEALKLRKNWDAAYLLRAKAKVRLKDGEGADDDFMRAAAVSKDPGPIHLARAKAWDEGGRDALPIYQDAARAGSVNQSSLLALGNTACKLLQEGLAKAQSPEIAARIVEALKKYPEAAETIKQHEVKILAQKTQQDEIVQLIADLGGIDEVRAKAEARLIAIGKPALEQLERARYHEVPEARVQGPRIAKLIIENAARQEIVARYRAKAAAVRKRWTARDFKDFESEVLAGHFDYSVRYVPVRTIGEKFFLDGGDLNFPQEFQGKTDQLTADIVDALEKNDGFTFVGRTTKTVVSEGKAQAPRIVSGPVPFGPILIVSLPDKAGWSAYIVVHVGD